MAEPADVIAQVGAALATGQPAARQVGAVELAQQQPCAPVVEQRMVVGEQQMGGCGLGVAGRGATEDGDVQAAGAARVEAAAYVVFDQVVPADSTVGQPQHLGADVVVQHQHRLGSVVESGAQHALVVDDRLPGNTEPLQVERAVQASGLDWLIVRPGEFATNALLIWGPSTRSGRRVVEPYPEQAGNPIHERDITDVVVADLLEPGRRGRVDTIVGPDTLTKREQVAAIAAAVGDHITLDEVTPEQALSFYREQGGFAADNADWLYGLTSYDGVEGVTDEPLDATPSRGSAYRTLADVLGCPGRSYAQWARDHASDFTRTAGPGHD